MSIFDAITSYFTEQEHLGQQAANELTPFIAESTELLSETLLSGNKILSIGSDDLAFMTEHFSNLLIYNNKFARPGLPVLNLSNNQKAYKEKGDHASNLIQQLTTFAQPNDCIFMMAGETGNEALKETIHSGLEHSLNMVIISDCRNEAMAKLIPSEQVLISVPQVDGTIPLGLYFHLSLLLAELIERRLFSDFT